MSVPTLRLPSHLEAALRSGHPWVYRTHMPDGTELETGSWVRVEAGSAAAFGLFDADGPIAVRLFDHDTLPTVDWWDAAIDLSLKRRTPLVEAGHNAYRLIFGEGDGLPGLVVDRYGRHAVLQVHSEALRPYLPRVAKRIRRQLNLRGVVERRSGELHVWAGEVPPPEVTILEHGLKFLVNMREGQKTGLFLDHREQRQWVRMHADGRRVLNLFAYAGGFSVYALAGSAAEVVSVDIARPALRDAERNVKLNVLPAARHRTVQADVFASLDALAKTEGRFDLVICDPPSLAKSKRQRDRAVAAYARLHTGLGALVKPGGNLLSASCTTQVTPAEFERAALSGLRSGGRHAAVVERRGHAVDHPVRKAFPEGRYLKSLWLQLDADQASK